MKISNKNYQEIVIRFVAKNQFILGIVFLFFMLLIAFNIYSQNSKLEEMKDMLNANTSKVIGLTDNGTVVEIEKQKLQIEQEKNTVGRALKLLIVSRSEVTKGFSVSTFKTPTEILENSENLQEFFEYIMVQDREVAEKVILKIKNDKGKYDEKNALVISDASMSYLNAYLEALKIKIQSNQLPHFITINSSKIDSFDEKDNTFNITMSIDVTMQNWIGKDLDNKDKYETSVGKYEIKASGYFDLRTRTTPAEDSPFKGYNKLGLHFDTINITMPNGITK